MHSTTESLGSFCSAGIVGAFLHCRKPPWRAFYQNFYWASLSPCSSLEFRWVPWGGAWALLSLDWLNLDQNPAEDEHWPRRKHFSSQSTAMDMNTNKNLATTSASSIIHLCCCFLYHDLCFWRFLGSTIFSLIASPRGPSWQRRDHHQDGQERETVPVLSIYQELPRWKCTSCQTLCRYSDFSGMTMRTIFKNS